MKYHWKLPEYVAWCRMKDRCYKPSCEQFKNYGARGITVCDAWRESFHAFYADIGPRPSQKHSLDRIDVNGNYGPGNCRWATPLEQANNTRTNIRITHNGETKNVSEWARFYGIGESTLRKRLFKMNWPFEKAMLFPLWRAMQGRTPPNKGKHYQLKNPGRSQRPRAQEAA